MIIGITGTLGAGKGTIVQYLIEKRGFKHFSVRSFLNKEIARRGLPSNRDTMTTVANDLRAQYGSGYISEQLLARALVDNENAIIESIRSIGEAEYLKSHGAYLWAIDADVHKRYDRILGRASETDAISFEKFVADEQREFANADPTKQNISGVMAIADMTFHNDDTLEDLYTQIDQALSRSYGTVMQN